MKNNYNYDSYYLYQNGDTLSSIADHFNVNINDILKINPNIDPNFIYEGQYIMIPKNNTSSTYRLNKNTSDEILGLNNSFRNLWENHVFWTRLVILGIVFNLPDVEFSTTTLLKNPDDFSAILGKYYGNEFASKIRELLRSHLIIAANIVKNAKAGNNTDELERQWYQNANDISQLLSSVNPFWSSLKWQKALYDHLRLTKQEVVYYLTKNYSSGVNIFDKIEVEALEMADMFTDGIVKQFYTKK